MIDYIALAIIYSIALTTCSFVIWNDFTKR